MPSCTKSTAALLISVMFMFIYFRCLQKYCDNCKARAYNRDRNMYGGRPPSAQIDITFPDEKGFDEKVKIYVVPYEKLIEKDKRVCLSTTSTDGGQVLSYEEPRIVRNDMINKLVASMKSPVNTQYVVIHSPNETFGDIKISNGTVCPEEEFVLCQNESTSVNQAQTLFAPIDSMFTSAPSQYQNLLQASQELDPKEIPEKSEQKEIHQDIEIPSSEQLTVPVEEATISMVPDEAKREIQKDTEEVTTKLTAIPQQLTTQEISAIPEAPISRLPSLPQEIPTPDLPAIPQQLATPSRTQQHPTTPPIVPPPTAPPKPPTIAPQTSKKTDIFKVLSPNYFMKTNPAGRKKRETPNLLSGTFCIDSLNDNIEIPVIVISEPDGLIRKNEGISFEVNCEDDSSSMYKNFNLLNQHIGQDNNVPSKPILVKLVDTTEDSRNWNVLRKIMEKPSSARDETEDEKFQVHLVQAVSPDKSLKKPILINVMDTTEDSETFRVLQELLGEIRNGDVAAQLPLNVTNHLDIPTFPSTNFTLPIFPSASFDSCLKFPKSSLQHEDFPVKNNFLALMVVNTKLNDFVKSNVTVAGNIQSAEIKQ